MAGTKKGVGQPNGTVRGAGTGGTRAGVGTRVGAGTVGATVGVKVGNVGVIVGATGRGKVGIAGVRVGATVGVKIGSVGVKVGVRPHITAGNVAPVTGSVGTVVGAKATVGQSAIPPIGVVIVVVKGRVGAARGVIPGASVGAVGRAVNGGKIRARPIEVTRLKTKTRNKLMRKNLSDLI